MLITFKWRSMYVSYNLKGHIYLWPLRLLVKYVILMHACLLGNQRPDRVLRKDRNFKNYLWTVLISCMCQLWKGYYINTTYSRRHITIKKGEVIFLNSQYESKYSKGWGDDWMYMWWQYETVIKIYSKIFYFI